MGCRRVRAVAGLAIVLVFGVAAPASAQYGPGGGGGGGATHNPQASASVSDATLCPGQSVTLTTSPGSFVGGSTVTIRLLRLVSGSVPVTLGTATVAGDGSVTATVVIPPGTATSNFVIYAEGSAIPGGIRVLAAAVVVNAAFPGCSQPLALQSASPSRDSGSTAEFRAQQPRGVRPERGSGDSAAGHPGGDPVVPARSQSFGREGDGGFGLRFGGAGLAAVALILGLALLRSGRRSAYRRREVAG